MEIKVIDPGDAFTLSMNDKFAAIFGMSGVGWWFAFPIPGAESVRVLRAPSDAHVEEVKKWAQQYLEDNQIE